MKKNEPFKDMNIKKVLSPKTLVLFLMLSLLVSYNGTTLAATNTPVQTKSAKPAAFEEKEVPDDNTDGNDDEQDDESNPSTVTNQDDNSETDDGAEFAEEENKKEQLNEIVSEEQNLQSTEAKTEDTQKTEIKTEDSFKIEEAKKQGTPSSEDNLVEVYNGPANVEVRTRHKFESYKERRTRHGFTVGISSENVYMHDYTSIYDGKLYEELWGQEDVSLPQLNLNYKFNFILGSLNIGAGYGHGSILDDRTGEERTIIIDKTAGNLQFLFDNFMKEPYFVPYVGVSLFNFKITEQVKLSTSSEITDHSFTTDTGNAFTVGFLIQLNWMEKEASKEAYLENGLENTYLDIYWTQYENPNQAPDPSTQSDFNWGAGLRIEF
jgi:hypothetical protein